MHRIDEPGNVSGQFVRSSPQTGQRATRVGADWPNAVQEELAKFVEATGGELDKANHHQVYDAVVSMINAAVAGAVGIHSTLLLEGKWMHGATYDASHYKVPDGSTLSRTTYAAAWTAVQASGMLAADSTDKANNPGKWGPGDGSTTFELPDLRDQFLRIYKGSKGGAVGPALGGFKANQNKAHTHSAQLDSGGSFAGSGDITMVQGTTTPTGGHYNLTTGSSGGNEANPDHTSVIYVIRVL